VLVLTENLLRRGLTRSSTQVNRSLDTAEQAVRDAGLVVASRRPSLVLMNAPIDSDSRLLRAWWRAISRLVRTHEASGWVVGALLYPVELVLTARLGESPSTEMLICRKPGPTRS
jgi:hypothetical protein